MIKFTIGSSDTSWRRLVVNMRCLMEGAKMKRQQSSTHRIRNQPLLSTNNNNILIQRGSLIVISRLLFYATLAILVLDQAGKLSHDENNMYTN